MATIPLCFGFFWCHVHALESSFLRSTISIAVFCLQNWICLLVIFADQVFIDPTFCGILVCGPLQSFVVYVRTSRNITNDSKKKPSRKIQNLPGSTQYTANNPPGSTAIYGGTRYVPLWRKIWFSSSLLRGKKQQQQFIFYYCRQIKRIYKKYNYK